MGNGEPKTCTGLLLFPAGSPLEALEDAHGVLLGNAGTAVLHAHDQFLLVGRGDDVDISSRGELDGVPHQVVHDLVKAQRVDQAGGWQVVQAGEQRHALGPCHGQVGLRDVHDQRAHVHGGGLHAEPALTDAGMEQEVVHQPSQPLGGTLHDAQFLLIGLAQGGGVQVGGHAQDGVERGAHLVAHVGEHVASRPVAGLGAGPRHLQLLHAGIDPFLHAGQAA